jgi:endonuclease III
MVISKSVLSQMQLAKCIYQKLSRLYPHGVQSTLKYRHKHEFLIAVILSAQTKDEQVNKATNKLFEKYPDFESLMNADEKQIAIQISSIGLYKVKSRYIQKVMYELDAIYDKCVPDKLDELLKLPGVGRKTASVVLHELFGKNEGIAVDTHVKRLAKKYGLTKSDNPKKIETDLMGILPKSTWGQFSKMLIQYGRDYCRANCKKCPRCPLWSCISENKK